MSKTPASPCKKICNLDDTRSYCLACQRTLPEIATWGRMSLEEQESIIADLPARVDGNNPEK